MRSLRVWFHSCATRYALLSLRFATKQSFWVLSEQNLAISHFAYREYQEKGVSLSCKLDSDYQKDRHPIGIKELVLE